MPLLTAPRLALLLAGEVAAVEAEIAILLPPAWVSGAERLMRFRLRQIQGDPAAEPWLLRPIARRPEPGTDGPALAIGLINFHGPPDDRGFVEVGYGLEPEARGYGYAVEAVRALFNWAATAHKVRQFRAAIAPGNERSHNLVRKLGMTRVGAQWDEDDGLELIFTVERWGTGG